MNKAIELKLLTKESIIPHIDSIAQMRIQNFKEFPYLYQGNLFRLRSQQLPSRGLAQHFFLSEPDQVPWTLY